MLCAALFFFPLVLSAQQLATASIGGTVTDSSEKAVANVVVTLENSSQGTVRTFTTQSDGSFSFTTLEAATYSLSAAGPTGFAKWQEVITSTSGRT